MAIYIGDNKKVASETGWTPTHSAKKILEDTYKWIRDNESTLSKVLV